MKRLFKDVLLVLLLALGFVFGSLDVYAEEASSDVSRWTVPPIEKLTTSDGITIVYNENKSNLVIDYGWGDFSGELVLDVTIPADYDKEEIVIAPEAFQKISNIIYENIKEYGDEAYFDENYFQFDNAFQAGDDFKITLIINNLSKFDYYYEETSFEIFPTEPIVYVEKDSSTEGTGEYLFNGMKLPEGFAFRRTYNTALKVLIPNSSARKMTDDVIDVALKNAGYTGIDEYDKYLLDFYNEKYGTSYTRLDQFNKGIIREMLSDVDPLYVLNEPYRNGLGLNFVSSIPSRAKETINNALKQKGYNDPLKFILDYYNVSNISELTDDMINELYHFAGNETGGYSIETNKTILALAYNFFNNEGLAFYFDEKNDAGEYVDNSEINNADYTGTSYSIGSYMRDETKGDKEILERAGTLKSGSENTLSGVLKNVGAYTPNAYIGYNFMVDLQLKYKAKTGNLIIKYVDRDGNELLSDVISTELVGKEYLTNPEDIKNYKLFDIEGEESGKYIDGTITVIYVYDKVGSEETGEITPPNTGVSTTNSSLLILCLLFINMLGVLAILGNDN